VVAKIFLVALMVLAAISIWIYPNYHHSRRFAKAWFEEKATHDPRSRAILESELRSERRIEISIKALLLGIFVSSAIGLKRLSNKDRN
jgi:hypothetical protein